jgi:hypothetical protein
MTNILSSLTSIKLKSKLLALATLDALICPEWEYRYFSYNSKWSVDEEMASMRDGEGSDYFVWFFEDKIAIKGCSVNSNLVGSKTYLERIFNEVPCEFSNFLNEAAFTINEASFIFWYQENIGWSKVSTDMNDGSEDLLSWILGDEFFHKNWIKDYYDLDMNIDDVAYIFQGKTVTQDFLQKINFSGDIKSLISDLEEIGFPFELV